MKPNKVARYWDKRGATYDRSWQSVAKKRLSRMETDLAREAIASFESASNRLPVKVLDIGVAIGRICDEILKHTVALYGTDISKTMVQYCQKKYARNKKARQFKLHDVHNPLPKEWGKFDVVTAYRVLAYTHGLPKELSNIYRALKPGGILVFSCPNKYSSVFLPKLLHKGRLGYEVGYSELKAAIEDSGFSDYKIVGYSRLLDTFYDRSNSELSANILFGIEKLLSLILGPRLFVRLFYVTCKK